MAYIKTMRRGTRTEDTNALAIASMITERGQAILESFREEIRAMPEIAKQRERTRVTDAIWEHYLTTLARKAIAGEDLLATTNEFNRLYVFPFRKRKERNG